MRIHLETRRLVLRAFEPDDVDNLVALDADPEVRRYLLMPEPPAREEIETTTLPRFVSCYATYPGFGFWAAIEKTSSEFVGWFHFRPNVDDPEEIELGYRLLASAWGKGYATEGSLALIEKGISEQGVTRITATALADNAASIRVMEKCGLTLEQCFLYNGIPAVKYGLSAQHRWKLEGRG